MSPMHWRANALADELAEHAAMRAQLPATAIKTVRRLDREAKEVQEHLVAVSLEVTKFPPNFMGPIPGRSAWRRPVRGHKSAAKSKRMRPEARSTAFARGEGGAWRVSRAPPKIYPSWHF